MTRSLRFFAVVLGASILGACSGGAQSPMPPSAPSGAGGVVPQSKTGPSLAWSPSGTFDFGTQTGGSQTSQVFTLTNSGGTATGVLAVAFRTGSSSDFSITADTCTGTALGPKKSCSVTIQFAPAAGDDVTGTLAATGKKAPASASVNLKGNAIVTTTFNYTGAVQTLTVPSGVTQIEVDVVGASGGTDRVNGLTVGGLGEEVKATLTVTPGTLYVFVGGAGGPGVSFVPHPGFNGGGGAKGGGGGGGASDIRTVSSDLTSRLIVAGGGGGASQNDDQNGGNAGFAAGVDGNCSSGFSGCGGGGGSSTGGVAGAVPTGADTSTGVAGTAGTLGVGADASTGDEEFSGAGGGGYYGGGSGAFFNRPGCGDACASLGGGGGGGSSFLAATGTLISDNLATSMQCDTSNDGCVTISY